MAGENAGDGMWRFDLIRPCRDCPFRKDATFAFRPSRAREIAETVVRDLTFQCHKTVDYSGDDGGQPGDRPQQCAGALILHEKLGRPNWRYRFAHMLGLYDPSRLDMTAPVVDSVEEFVRLQSERR